MIAGTARRRYGVRMSVRRLASGALVIVAAGCGGSSSTSPSTAPVTTVQTFAGTTRQSAPGSCSGDSHDFAAQDGAVAVALQETGDPEGALSVQVCAGGIDNRDCTINQQRIAVGQTLTGRRKGIASQNLKLLPHSCLSGGPFDPSASITYRVQVTYQK